MTSKYEGDGPIDTAYYDADSVELTIGGVKYKGFDFKVEYLGDFVPEGPRPCEHAVEVDRDENPNRVRSLSECRRCGLVWYGCKAKRTDYRGYEAWGKVGVQTWSEEKMPKHEDPSVPLGMPRAISLEEAKEAMVPSVQIGTEDAFQGAIEFSAADHAKLRSFQHARTPGTMCIEGNTVVVCACGRQLEWEQSALGVAALRHFVSEHFEHVEHKLAPGQVWEKRFGKAEGRVLEVVERFDCKQYGGQWIVRFGTMRGSTFMSEGSMLMCEAEIVVNWRATNTPTARSEIRRTAGVKAGDVVELKDDGTVGPAKRRGTTAGIVAGIDLARGGDESAIAIFRAAPDGRKVLIGHGRLGTKYNERFVTVSSDSDIVARAKPDLSLRLARALFDEALEQEARGLAEGHLILPVKFTLSSSLQREGQKLLTESGDAYQRPSADDHVRRVLDIMWGGDEERGVDPTRPEKRAECELRARTIVARMGER